MDFIKNDKYKVIITFLLFAIIGLIFYWPSLLGGPIFIDDDGFIFESIPMIKSTSPLLFWDRSGEFARSWPLSYTVFWFLYQLVQETYWVYKAVNLFFHVFNAFLIIHIFKDRFSEKTLFLSALIYLIHPIQIETVSWIFQLNTILATTFFLLSYKAFLVFIQKRHFLFYVLALYLFLFSLLSKISTVLLPFLFAYHAFSKYKSRKLFACIILLPFFLVSLYKGLESSNALNYLNIDKRLSIDKPLDSKAPSKKEFQPTTKQASINKPSQETQPESIEFSIGPKLDIKELMKEPTVDQSPINEPSQEVSSETNQPHPLVEIESEEPIRVFDAEKVRNKSLALILKKLKISAASFSYYISHFLFPLELSIIMPDITKRSFFNFFSWILTIVFLILLLTYRKIKTFENFYLMSFLIFALIPVLGFVFIPFMNFSLVADHWFYLGMIPASILFANIIEKLNHKSIVISLFLSLWCFQSFSYVHLFNHKYKIIEKAIEVSPRDFRLRMELATTYLEDGKLEEAQKVIDKALMRAEFSNNMLLLMQGGYIDRQLESYDKLAVKIHRIGIIYLQRNDLENAKLMLKQLKEISASKSLIKSLESKIPNSNSEL